MAGNSATYSVCSRCNELPWVGGEMYASSSIQSRDILYLIFQ